MAFHYMRSYDWRWRSDPSGHKLIISSWLVEYYSMNRELENIMYSCTYMLLSISTSASLSACLSLALALSRSLSLSLALIPLLMVWWFLGTIISVSYLNHIQSMYLSNPIAIEYGLCIYFIPEKQNYNGLHPKHSNAVLLISSYLNIKRYAVKDLFLIFFHLSFHHHRCPTNHSPSS